MNTTNKIAVMALLSSLSLSTYASNFNYNHVQIGYLTGDFDGFELKGMFEINKEVFIKVGFISATEDSGFRYLNDNYDFDFTQFDIGAGYHMPINKKTDAVFTLSLAKTETDSYTFIPVPFPGRVVGGSADDTGLLATGGVRFNPNPQVELAAGVHHITTFNGDSGVHGEARYNINKEMSAGVGLSTGDYATDYLSIDFRMHF